MVILTCISLIPLSILAFCNKIRDFVEIQKTCVKDMGYSAYVYYTDWAGTAKTLN